MINVYHYSRIRDWRDIKRGSYHTDDVPGLGSGRRLEKIYHPAWETSAAFALLAPEPDNWKRNPIFGDMLKVLEQDVGQLLLEIGLDEDDKGAFILDWGHMESFLRGKNCPPTPPNYKHGTQEEAEKAYLESKVSLSDFLHDPKKYRLLVPEVAIMHNVPFDRIRICERQPIIERELAAKDHYAATVMRELEASEPEPREWLARYKQKTELQREITPWYKKKLW